MSARAARLPIFLAHLIVAVAAAAGLAPPRAAAHPLEPIQVLPEGGGGAGALWGARALAVSPDGLHAYVIGTKSRSLAAVRLADLAAIDVERDGAAGVEGLLDPWDVAIAPDGGHVYAVSGVDNAVVVFARDATTGALAFVESVPTGLEPNNPSASMLGAALTVSPDGTHVYVANHSSRPVARFARDAGTGALTLLGTTELAGFERSVSIAVSPDGEHVYVGREAFNQTTPRLEVLDRDPASGALTPVSAYTEPFHDFESCCDWQRNVLHEIAFSPGGEQVYVAIATMVDNSLGYDEAHNYGALAVFARDAASGALSLVESHRTAPPGHPPGPSRLRGASGAAVSPDGAHVYVASHVSDAVVVFARDAETGALTEIGSLVDRLDGVSGLNRAFAIALAPGGARAFVASFDDDALVALDRDPSAGTLAFADLVEDGGARGIFGGFAVAVSPDGHFVYGSGDDAFARYTPSPPPIETDAPTSSIGILARDPATGLLSPAGEYESLPAAARLIVPTSQHLYALVDEDVYCFARDPQTGALMPIQTLIGAARDLVATSDGQHLYVAPPGSGASPIVHYRRAAPGEDLEIAGEYAGSGAWSASAVGLALGPAEGRLHSSGLYAGVPSVLAFDREADGSLVYRFATEMDPETGLGASGLVVRTHTLYASFARGFLVHRRWLDGSAFLWSTGRSYLFDDAEQWPRFRRVDALPDESAVYFAYGYDSNYYGYELPGLIQVRQRVAGSDDFELVEYEGAADLRARNGFAISSDGRHLYAASGFTDEMVVFATPEPGAGLATLAAAAALAAIRAAARARPRPAGGRTAPCARSGRRGSSRRSRDGGRGAAPPRARREPGCAA